MYRLKSYYQYEDGSPEEIMRWSQKRLIDYSLILRVAVHLCVISWVILKMTRILLLIPNLHRDAVCVHKHTLFILNYAFDIVLTIMEVFMQFQKSRI